MNFMDRMETGEVPMELKYCERCGGLWLRRQGEDVVYCRSCQEYFGAWDRMCGAGIAARPRSRKRELHGQGAIEVPADIAGIEVRP